MTATMEMEAKPTIVAEPKQHTIDEAFEAIRLVDAADA